MNTVAQARQEMFRRALVALVNAQIGAQGLRPEDAAAVMCQEARAALECLGWLPHGPRAAREHLVAAAACLLDGRVIPVPGFEVLFPGVDDVAAANPEGNASRHSEGQA